MVKISGLLLIGVIIGILEFDFLKIYYNINWIY